MGDASYVQGSFIGGEWGKTSQGRYDKPELYRTALNVCLNAYPLEQGAWTRRPGGRLLAVTRGGVAGRVIAFDFKATAPYEMEFTSGYLRFFSGNSLVTTDAAAISSITTDSPAKVNTTAALPAIWATGNTVYFQTLGTSCPLLQNRPCLITVTGGSQFTIADAITGSPIDGSTLGVASMLGTAQAARVLEIATAYTGSLWQSLRAIKADIPISTGTTPGAVFLQGSIKPYALTVATVPSDSSFATFTLAAVVFKDGPYFDPVPGGALATPSGLKGVINLTLSFNAYDATVAYSVGDYVTSSSVNYKSRIDANLANTPVSSPTAWVAVSASDPVGPNGFQGSDINRMIRLYSEPAIWAAGTSYSTGDVVSYGGAGLAYSGAVTYRAIANSTGAVPTVSPTIWAIYPQGAIWTWGRITAMLNEVDRALAGSVNIGDLTAGGGLAAAFDGVTSQARGACASKSTTISTGSLSGYAGKNYSAASDQKIQQGTLFPSSDSGLAFFTSSSPPPFTSVVVNLRGKASAPASAADGTLLGTTTSTFFGPAPITVVSTDQATAWKYVWFEIVASVVNDHGTGTLLIAVAECKFFNPPGTGTSNGISVQIVGDALLYTTAIRTWRLGLYSDTTGWPNCGTWHEGRLWLGGVVSNRFDTSCSDDPFNMAPTNAFGVVAGNNAISYRLNAPDVNPILWMEPDQQGVIMGSAAGEWLVQASNLNSPITPTSIQAHRSMKHRCANIEPRRCDLTLVAVQAQRRALLELFADVYSGKFAADNIAEHAKHLTKSGIAELAYQQELTPILWARRTDGRLVGVTYRRKTLNSSQPAEVRGWHGHTLGSGRTVESICMGRNADGTMDALTMVTSDGSVRHVEKLAAQFEEDDALASAWFIDDALVPASVAVSTTAITGAPYGGVTLQGLWPLTGATVTVMASGLDCGDFLVTAGAVFVPFGDGVSDGTGLGLFTQSFAETASFVVGFTYNSDGQLLRPNAAAETGARNGPAFAKLRRSHQMGLQAVNTGAGSPSGAGAGIQFGTDFAKLDPLYMRDAYDVAATPLATFTGILRVTLDYDADSLDSQPCWRVSRPLPATVAAVGAFLHTKDI